MNKPFNNEFHKILSAIWWQGHRNKSSQSSSMVSLQPEKHRSVIPYLLSSNNSGLVTDQFTLIVKVVQDRENN